MCCIDCAMQCFKYEWTLAMNPFFILQYFYTLPTPYTPFLLFLLLLFCYYDYKLCYVFFCLCAIVYLCNMRYTKAVVGTEVQYLSDDPQKTQTGPFLLSVCC